MCIRDRFTVVDGQVRFEHKSKKRYRVSVYPVAAAAPAKR